MEDSHGEKELPGKYMNVTKYMPVLFRLFSYSLPELQWLLTGVQGLHSAVQSSFGNAHRDLTLAGSLTSEHCFPLHKKAFVLAQHSPVLYSSAHL